MGSPRPSSLAYHILSTTLRRLGLGCVDCLPPTAYCLPTTARLLSLLIAIALGVVVASPAPASLAGPRHFEYRIAWNGLPAGSATVDIKDQEFAGAAGYSVRAAARTNAVVDLFWSFRGVAHTTLLADGLVPLRFTYDRQTNRLPESTWLDFDRIKQRAQGTHFKGDQRKDAEVDATDLTDPITAILHACATGVEPGGERRYHVFTGESQYLVALQAVGEEEITVPAGRFRALKIVPAVWKIKEAAEPDQRLHQATIWVTPDSAHTILRVRGEVFIGAVTLDLVGLGVAS